MLALLIKVCSVSFSTIYRVTKFSQCVLSIPARS